MRNLSLLEYFSTTMDTLSILSFASLILLLGFCGIYVFACIMVNRNSEQINKELLCIPGVYEGPAGEPLWDGKLPEKVDDYVKPRYVYEDLYEDTAYLPEHGRVIGYRISPNLVIHSRIKRNAAQGLIEDYINRFGGELLDFNDLPCLNLNWEDISALRRKAGDTPLPIDGIWAKGSYHPVLVCNLYSLSYKDMIGHPAWGTIILKR